MSKNLERLLNVARTVKMTREEHEQQRRSFAFGNTNIENSRITKATVNRAAESLAEEDSEQGRRAR
jgi:hypothetical protein